MADTESSKHEAAKRSEQGSGEEFKLAAKEKIAFGILMIISFYAALESSAIGIALPNIAQSVHASSIQAFWVGTSYVLASAVCQPPFAAFSHTFGRLPVTISATLLFIIGSIICALARNVPTILVGRTLQGAGCGGGLSLIEIIMTDMIPLKLRAGYFGLNALAWALGSALSPLIGGAFAEKVTWRWIFWIMVPFAVVSLISLPISLRLRPKKGSLGEKIKEVDGIGCFLIMASTTSTLIAISWGGIMFSWSSWHTLVPLLLGVAGIALFVVWEQYFAKQPLVPMGIFGNLTANTVYWQSLVSGLNMWSISYYMPLFFRGVKGYSVIISAVSVLPTLLVVAPSAAIAGFAMRKIGSYRKVLWAGWVVATLGAGVMIRLDPEMTIPQWIFTNSVGGIGIGLMLPVMRLAIQASTSDKYVGHAAAMVMTFRTLGMSLSNAILSVIFQTVFQQKLEKSTFSGSIEGLSKNVLDVVQVIDQLPSDSNDRLVLQQVLAQSLKMIWVTMVAFNAVSLLSNFFIQELSLERALNTEQGVDRGSGNTLESGASMRTEDVGLKSDGHLTGSE